MQIVVGISDLRISQDPGSMLLAYSLGAGLGVGLFDPDARVGGILHFMFPDSSFDPDRADKNPCMFADTGIAALVGEMTAAGGDPSRFRAVVAGGAKVMAPPGFLDIGEKNLAACRKALDPYGTRIVHEAVGGSKTRTLRLSMEDGRAWIKVPGGEFEEI